MALTIEQEVCSLDLAKWLKKAGYKLETKFVYNLRTGNVVKRDKQARISHQSHIAAPTVNEADDLLPSAIAIPKDMTSAIIFIRKIENDWHVAYVDQNDWHKYYLKVNAPKLVDGFVMMVKELEDEGYLTK